MYHRAKPYYIHERLTKLGRMFALRVLLVLVDVHDSQQDLRDLSKVALVHNLTLMLAWSNEEAARYIETYKLLERRAPDAIRERAQADYTGQLTALLTNVRGVNKTDVLTLTSHLGSLSTIAKASTEQLSSLPGFGPVKVKRLREALNQTFRVGQPHSWHERSARTVPAAEEVEAENEALDAARQAVRDASPSAVGAELGIRRGGERDIVDQGASTASLLLPPPSAEPEEASPSNPALRAALAFRTRRPAESLEPEGSAKRPRIQEVEASTSRGKEKALVVDDAVSSDTFEEQLRNMEDLDEEAQLRLALELSGETPRDTALSVSGTGAQQASEAPIAKEDDLDLDDLDELNEEEQLRLAIELSQRGL